MCGRIALYTPPLRMARLLEATVAAGLDTARSPSWNVGPSRTLLGLTEPVEDGGRTRLLDEYRWGLIPSWAPDPAIGNRLFNARAESLAAKASFRAAYGARRLAIPVDGFYEWHRTPTGTRQPYFFARADGAPVVFAGLYEFWRDPAVDEDAHPWVRSCTIITTAAGEDMAAVHDRMPAVLAPDAFDVWLDPAAERPVLDALLAPPAGGTLVRRPVGRAVGNVNNDGPGLLAEDVVADDAQATLF